MTTQRPETQITPVENNQMLIDHQRTQEEIKERFTPRDRTDAEKEDASNKCAAYYAGMMRSIKSIDDGKSQPDIVAKAAISENIVLLEGWKRSEAVAALEVNDASFNRQVEQMLMKLPSETHVDEASSMVLRWRSKSFRNEGEERVWNAL